MTRGARYSLPSPTRLWGCPSEIEGHGLPDALPSSEFSGIPFAPSRVALYSQGSGRGATAPSASLGEGGDSQGPGRDGPERPGGVGNRVASLVISHFGKRA